MSTNLQEARALAEKIRFAGDLVAKTGDSNSDAVSSQRAILAQRGLEISPALTPLLAETLDLVGERLFVPKESITSFVYASPELQASCFSSGTDECVLSFSSRLIDLLSPAELQYVAGHEIGHFIFRHGITTEMLPDSMEFLMESRAKEISADRAGFLACQSLETSLSAMIKTASGLDDRHLRFDVHAFLSQVNDDQNEVFEYASRSTHPSWVVRARALLWFSTSEMVTRGIEHYSKDELKRLDANIDRDLERFVDGNTRKRVKKAKWNAELWMSMKEVVNDGVFDRNEQEIVRSRFGDETLEKLKSLFSNLGAEEVQALVLSKYEDATAELALLLPSTYAEEISALQENVEHNFSDV